MLKNIELKILSILIAVLLWFVVINSDVVQMKLYVPISLKNIPENYVAVSNVKLLNIEVTGSNLLLKNISHRDILLEVDVSNLKKGNNKYKIKFDDIKTPRGINAVKIEPEYININIDKLIKKDLKVVPTFIGEPKLGYKVETVKSYPEVVETSGAESKLKDINFIETLPINLSEKKDAIIYAIGMKIPEGIKKVEPEQIDVFVSFNEDIVKEKFENFPIQFINKKDNFKYKVIPNAVTITLKARKDFLVKEKLNKYLKLYIDLSTINDTGTFLREINKIVDSNLKIISMKPERVRIEVTK